MTRIIRWCPYERKSCSAVFSNISPIFSTATVYANQTFSKASTTTGVVHSVKLNQAGNPFIKSKFSFVKSKDQLWRKHQLSSFHKGIYHYSTNSNSRYCNDVIQTAIKSINSIPGPSGLPVIGTMYKYLPGFEYDARNIYLAHKRKFLKFGPIVKETINGTTVVHLFDPEDFKALFRQDGKYPSRGEIKGIKKYREERNRCVGLMNLEGPEWLRLRTKVAKVTLKRETYSKYIEAQSDITSDLVKLIKLKRNAKGEVDDLLNDFYRWSMESIGMVCFNTRLGTLNGILPDKESQQFINAVSAFMHHLNKIIYFWSYHKRGNTKTWKEFCLAQDTIWSESCKYLAGQKSREKKLPIKSFQEVISAGGPISEDEIISMTNDIFFASVDTTAHCLAFLLYQLAKHQDKQAHLYDEIKSLCQRHEQVSEKMLRRAPYLKAVLKESVRLYPIIGTSCRTISNGMILHGYEIPTGTKVLAHSMFTSRCEEYFPKADEFIPERWLRNDNGYTNTHPYAFLPFGFGQRGCTGRRLAEQQLYVATFKIIQHFHLEYHYKDIGMLTRTVNKPDKPLLFSFNDR